MTEKKLMYTDQPKPRVTFSLVMGVLMAVLGAAFQYGYNIASLNAPTEEIQFNFYPCKHNITNETKECVDDLKDQRTFYYSIITAAFPAAGCIGSLMVSSVVGRFGRKNGLMVNNLFSLLAAIFMGISKPINVFWTILVGRVFIGIFAGLATGLVPMYISELSPKEWRGAIGVLNQLLITIGILVAQILGLDTVLGGADTWHILLALTFLPSLLQLLSYALMPKSPRYLLLDLNQEDNARNELVKLRGTDNVSAEMDEMRSEGEQAAETKVMSLMQVIGEKSVRWQLITIVVMMVAQQLSGINAVFFYTNRIFGAAGIPKGSAQDMASIWVGTVNVLLTVVSVVVIERVGRKKLIVFGFGSMILSCIALTVVLKMLESVPEGESNGSLGHLSIGLVIFYIVGFAVGPGPIPWILTAELFTQEARPAATMLGCVVNWACNFIIGISFPSVQEVTGAYVFLIFMAVCVLATVYLQVVMPETKGKTFNDINQMFAKRNGIHVQNYNDQSVLKPINNRDDL